MLYAYGENGFTFLLFQKILGSNELFKSLLSNLKRFSDGAIFGTLNKDAFNSNLPTKDFEIWLFPNFGKGSGFGEPDVIALWANIASGSRSRPILISLT